MTTDTTPKPPRPARADLFRTALNKARNDLSREYNSASEEAAEGGNLLTGTLDLLNATGLGIAKAGYEIGDTVSELVGANPDPYMREARSLVDHALDRMPGFSATLPPLRDPFGYPMKVRKGLIFQVNADDIVDAEQMRLIVETGKGIALPTGYDRDGVDLRDLSVTVDGKSRTAWDLLQERSIQPPGAKKTMKEAIAAEIGSERYGMAPDGDADVPGTKLFLLRRIVSEYREAGFKALLRAYPEAIGEPLARRAMEARAAWEAAQQGGPKGNSTAATIRKLMQGYGVDAGSSDQ